MIIVLKGSWFCNYLVSSNRTHISLILGENRPLFHTVCVKGLLNYSETVLHFLFSNVLLD